MRGKEQANPDFLGIDMEHPFEEAQTGTKDAVLIVLTDKDFVLQGGIGVDDERALSEHPGVSHAQG